MYPNNNETFIKKKQKIQSSFVSYKNLENYCTRTNIHKYKKYKKIDMDNTVTGIQKIFKYKILL